MRKVRWGVIGCGGIARTRTIPGMLLTENAQLVSVMARDLASAQAVQEQFGADRAYDSAEQMLENDELDAVYIATPVFTHSELTRLAADHGKHVLCEKPLTLTRADAEELYAAADRRGLALMEAMRPAHLPCLDRVRQAMVQVGPIRRADFIYCQYSSRYDKFKRGIVENAFDPSMGGGALRDIGVYPLAWMELLFGAPAVVQAAGYTLPGSIDAVGSALALYDGLTATAGWSKVHDGRNAARLEGERGIVELTPFPLPNRMTVAPRGGTPETVPLETDALDMRYELEDFIRLCAAPSNDPWRVHTLQVLTMMEQIRAQMQ